MENKSGFEELGDQISGIIDQAVKSNNFQSLNQSINQAVGDAVNGLLGNGSDALKEALADALKGGNGEAYKRYRYTPPESFRQKKQKEPEQKSLYSNIPGEKVKGFFKAAVGAVVAAASAIGIIANGFLSSLSGNNTSLSIASIFFLILLALGIGFTVSGVKDVGKADRYFQYRKALGGKTYVNFDQLSKVSHKPVEFVKKDVKSMIAKGWFLEGHVDEEDTCLITSDETYQQYQETRKQMEERRREEAKAGYKKPVITPEVQDVLDKGNEYLAKIRRSNDAIQGEEISQKISRMESIVQKIFDRAEEHPEVVGDLKKLMNYYLPMTIKLLDAYEEMDRQPVQGETIQNSKKEIEDTLDTLNLAFEKLLDSVFQDQALDVSSDISVLQTLLAQEGLTVDDLQKMRAGEVQQTP